MIASSPDRDAAPIAAALRSDGFVHLAARDTEPGLAARGAADWHGFADSWNRLEPDAWMADGGRYRRRRHARFAIEGRGPASAIRRLPDGPHWQARQHNALNGGVERHFAPVEPTIGAHPALVALLRFAADAFDAASATTEPTGAGPTDQWFVEVHQFRIEATLAEQGQPTPEGAHRDGVDFVLVTMVARSNVAAGTTAIFDPDGRERGRFTLTDPTETVLLDDRRCLHGVTAVRPVDPTRPAHRDVLVVTMRAGTVD